MQHRAPVLVLAWALAFLPTSLDAADPPPPPVGPPPEMKALAAMEGTWDVAFQYKLDPDGEWVTTSAVAVIRNVLDGAAQETEYTGEMMGATFTGTGLTCFDRETGMWQSTWTDNLTARITLYEGTMKGGKLIQEGTDRAQGRTIHSRITTSGIGDSRFEWTMEVSMDGKHYLTSARAVYTKR